MIKEEYTLEQLTNKINKLYSDTRTTEANSCLTIGKWLSQAKEFMSDNKDWVAYAKANFKFGYKSAQAYLSLYKEYGEDCQYSHLGYKKLVELKRLDNSTRVEFINANNVENISVQELKALINKELGIEPKLKTKKKQPYSTEKELEKKLEEALAEIERLKAQQRGYTSLGVYTEDTSSKDTHSAEERLRLSRQYLNDRYCLNNTEEKRTEILARWEEMKNGKYTKYVSEIDNGFQFLIGAYWGYNSTGKKKKIVEYKATSTDDLSVYIFDFNGNELYGDFDIESYFIEDKDFKDLIDNICEELLYGDIIFLLKDTRKYILENLLDGFSMKAKLEMEYAEKGYRYMVKKYHPDNKETGNRQAFEYVQKLKEKLENVA